MIAGFRKFSITCRELTESFDHLQLQRCYLQLESLQALGDNQPARLMS